jgi:hypothetical protein
MDGRKNDMGRFPANFIHDGSDEVLELFPDKATVAHSQRSRMCRQADTTKVGGVQLITVHEQRWAMVLLHGSFIVRKPARKTATKD